MTRPGRRLPTATVASLLLGLALMLPFDAAVTRVLGVTLLLTFVACGTWLVADPAFLTHDGDDGRLRGDGVQGPNHRPRAGGDRAGGTTRGPGNSS